MTARLFRVLVGSSCSLPIALSPRPLQSQHKDGFLLKCVKPQCVGPARFLIACEQGRLGDFPWVQYVHRGKTERWYELRLYELGGERGRGKNGEFSTIVDAAAFMRSGPDGHSQPLEPRPGLRPLEWSKFRHGQTRPLSPASTSSITRVQLLSWMGLET